MYYDALMSYSRYQAQYAILQEIAEKRDGPTLSRKVDRQATALRTTSRSPIESENQKNAARLS
jgi:hypothetical protein